MEVRIGCEREVASWEGGVSQMTRAGIATMASRFGVAVGATLFVFVMAMEGSAATMVVAVAVGDGARGVEGTPAATTKGRWRSSTDERRAEREFQHPLLY